MKNKNICGVILPSVTSKNSSLDKLNEIAQKYGVLDKFKIIQDVSRIELPKYLNSIDICISTQLPNTIGEMRTTAKLPEYMASGRYIFATNVGDARFYLPKEMLVDYETPENYYDLLAFNIDKILCDRKILSNYSDIKKIAESNFDYSFLLIKVRSVILNALNL